MIKKEDYNNLLDLEMNVKVDINTIKMPVSDVVKLQKGSIIDFKIPIGSPAKISINQVKIGEGEIMVFEKNLAIRINDISNASKILEIS